MKNAQGTKTGESQEFFSSPGAPEAEVAQPEAHPLDLVRRETDVVVQLHMADALDSALYSIWKVWIRGRTFNRHRCLDPTTDPEWETRMKSRGADGEPSPSTTVPGLYGLLRIIIMVSF